jgi:hypothetical protein
VCGVCVCVCVCVSVIVVVFGDEGVGPWKALAPRIVPQPPPPPFGALTGISLLLATSQCVVWTN